MFESVSDFIIRVCHYHMEIMAEPLYVQVPQGTGVLKMIIQIKMSIHDQHISQTKYYFHWLLREHKPWELFSTIYNHKRHKVGLP